MPASLTRLFLRGIVRLEYVCNALRDVADSGGKLLTSLGEFPCFQVR